MQDGVVAETRLKVVRNRRKNDEKTVCFCIGFRPSQDGKRGIRAPRPPVQWSRKRASRGMEIETDFVIYIIVSKRNVSISIEWVCRNCDKTYAVLLRFRL